VLNCDSSFTRGIPERFRDEYWTRDIVTHFYHSYVLDVAQPIVHDENLKISGNLTAAIKMSGVDQRSEKMFFLSGKTVYCQFHHWGYASV